MVKERVESSETGSSQRENDKATTTAKKRGPKTSTLKLEEKLKEGEDDRSKKVVARLKSKKNKA